MIYANVTITPGLLFRAEWGGYYRVISIDEMEAEVCLRHINTKEDYIDFCWYPETQEFFRPLSQLEVTVLELKGVL